MRYDEQIEREDNVKYVASEDISLSYAGTNNQLDAIWESITNQTTEVQKILLSRLKKLCSSSVKPYTIEELNERIDEAEAEEGTINANSFFAQFESQHNWTPCR